MEQPAFARCASYGALGVRRSAEREGGGTEREGGSGRRSPRITRLQRSAGLLSYGRRVLQAAFGPQRVEAAFDLERGAFAPVALEHLAVVSDVPHDAHHPVLGEPELFAVIALGADQLLDVGILGF